MTTRPMSPRTRITHESGDYEQRSYDIVKEFVIALGVVIVLVVVLAAIFSSPDDKAVTIKQWATAAPADFTATALAELDGSSDTAGYGPPYNTAADGQKIGPIGLQKAAGVTHPIDTAQAFVLGPLEASPQSTTLTSALDS